MNQKLYHNAPSQKRSLFKANNLSHGLKIKDLVGIPWRVAFALQDDGWYLRQDIIWNKSNPMPESVKDRCTKSHEYIFLMSKSKKYYFDSDAIKEPIINSENCRGRVAGKYAKEGLIDDRWGRKDMSDQTHKIKRDVWTVPTQSFREAHFATFPEKLIIPCIKTTRADAVILDPFMGAGTTAVVAKKLGRKYIGIELNPEYKAMAEKRIIKECGELF